jgi:hypothetical protein
LETSSNITSCRFISPLKNGGRMPLGIEIGTEAHPLMPHVFNLSFGPLNKAGQIDDQAKLSHADHSRVFSTILFAALAFLKEHPGKYLGIDGSNNARAYLYYRCIRNNFRYLSQHFNIHGIKYYVRILRKLFDQDENYPIDVDDLLAIPRLIEEEERMVSNRLYNYFIFNIK